MASQKGSYILTTIFEVEASSKPIDFVIACKESLAVNICAFRTFGEGVLEIALPSLSSCQQAVKDGVVSGGTRQFPQLPNGPAYPQPCQIGVENISFNLAPEDLKNELQTLLKSWGTPVRIDTKLYQHVNDLYETGEAVVYLVPADQLPGDSSLSSKTWNRTVTLKGSLVEKQESMFNARRRRRL